MRLRISAMATVVLCCFLLACQPTGDVVTPPEITPPATMTPRSTQMVLPTPKLALPDFSVTHPLTRARPTWRALLQWPDDCEAGFERLNPAPEDAGGLTLYELGGTEYLVFVTCTLGPYWEEARFYWLDVSSGSSPTVQALTFLEPPPDSLAGEGEMRLTEVLHGLPMYDPETKVLTNLAPARGLKDCGIWSMYHWDQGQFVLDEVRGRDCLDGAVILSPQSWLLLYPEPTGEVEGFRRVAVVDPALLPGIRRMEALSDAGVRLTMAAGDAVFRDGRWSTRWLEDGQMAMGVDAFERLWFLTETASGFMIHFRDAAGEIQEASEGWLPPAEETGLVRKGVITDHQGQVWVTTGVDVRVYDGVRWRIFAREAMGMPPAIDPDMGSEFTLLPVPGRAQIWVGQCDWGGPGPMGGGGARWYDGYTWRGEQARVGTGCVTTMDADAAGHVWIGLDHGLVWDFDQATGNWRQTVLPEPVDGSVRRGFPLVLDANPTGDELWLWAALCGGASCDVTRALYHWQGSAWIEIDKQGAFDEMQLYSNVQPQLLVNDTGVPWMFLDGTVLRVVQERFETYAALQVLVASFDVTGQMWVIGRYGMESPALWADTQSVRAP